MASQASSEISMLYQCARLVWQVKGGSGVVWYHSWPVHGGSGVWYHSWPVHGDKVWYGTTTGL